MMPFIRAMVALIGLALGCTGHQPSTPAAAGPTPARCPVTKPDPNAAIPPAILADAGTREGLFGNHVLWVALPPDGEARLVPLDGGYARKFMWWRLVEGNLAVEAKRLDGTAACEERGIVAPSYKTFVRAANRRPRQEQVAKRQGPAGWSSSIPSRTAPPGRRPGGMATDHSNWAARMTFDPPGYRACMLALRECVRRHQRLPEAVVVDGGPEFESILLRDVAGAVRVRQEDVAGGSATVRLGVRASVRDDQHSVCTHPGRQ